MVAAASGESSRVYSVLLKDAVSRLSGNDKKRIRRD